MRRFLLPFITCFALFSNYAFAEGVFSDDDDETRILSNYGYIVGTLNTTAWINYSDNYGYWRPYGLEDYIKKGKYIHYYFFL